MGIAIKIIEKKIEKLLSEISELIEQSDLEMEYKEDSPLFNAKQALKNKETLHTISKKQLELMVLVRITEGYGI